MHSIWEFTVCWIYLYSPGVPFCPLINFLTGELTREAVFAGDKLIRLGIAIVAEWFSGSGNSIAACWGVRLAYFWPLLSTLQWLEHWVPFQSIIIYSILEQESIFKGTEFRYGYRYKNFISNFWILKWYGWMILPESRCWYLYVEL